MSAKFAYSSDHECLVILPQVQQHWDGVNVVAQKLGQKQRQDFVQHEVASVRFALTNHKQQVLRHLLDGEVKESPHLCEV